jgi:hypothetical protein
MNRVGQQQRLPLDKSDLRVWTLFRVLPCFVPLLNICNNILCISSLTNLLSAEVQLPRPLVFGLQSFEG